MAYSQVDEILAKMAGFKNAEAMLATPNLGKPSTFWTQHNAMSGQNAPIPVNVAPTPSPMARPVTPTNPMPVPRVASLPAGTGANIPSNMSRLLGTPVTNPARLPGTSTTNTNIPSNINTLLGGTTVASKPMTLGVTTPTQSTPTSTPTGTTVAGSTGYNYMNDPSYQFRLQEGLRAILGQNAARGMLNSGRTLRELLRYGSDYASQEYQNEFARRYSLANLGLNAASQQVGGANVPIPSVPGLSGNVSYPTTQPTNFNLGGLSAYGGLMQGGASNVANAGQLLGAGQAGSNLAWGNAINSIGQYFGQNNPFSSSSTNNTMSPNMFSSPQLSGNFSGLRLY